MCVKVSGKDMRDGWTDLAAATLVSGDVSLAIALMRQGSTMVGSHTLHLYGMLWWDNGRCGGQWCGVPHRLDRL